MTIVPPLVTFITGDNVEDLESPAASPRAAADVLTEAVQRIHPSISAVTDCQTTTLLFGPSLRHAHLSITEDRLHITAYDGTDAAPRTQTLVSEWKDLPTLVGVATRLAGFLSNKES